MTVTEEKMVFECDWCACVHLFISEEGIKRFFNYGMFPSQLTK